MSAADDYEHAIGGLLMARGAGETRPVGSASIDRLRQIAAAWHRAVHVDSSMIPVHICDLDAVLADVSAERTRASAAEAECAQLTTERDAARAEAAGLRAIAEAADELVFCDYAAEVESYSETAPGSHAAAQVRAAEAYDALVKLRDAWRERQPTPTPALDAAGEGR